MPTRQTSKGLPTLLLLLFCSASMLFYWTRLEHLHASGISDAGLTQERKLTDLYPRWYGTRELLLHHRDPYSAAVTREIQLAYDGREQRFAYPLYVIIFLAPTVEVPFLSAQIAFGWLLAFLTAASLALWLFIIHVQLSLWARVGLFAIVFCSVPVLQGLRLLQFGLLVAALLTGAVAAIITERLFLGGTLLALATIKPPLTLLAIIFFVVWTAGNWRQRRALLVGFAGTLMGLVLASEMLVPGWSLRYPGVLSAYAQHATVTPLVGEFLANWLRWAVTIGGVFAMVLFCWRVRRQSASSTHFILAYAFASTLTVLIMPTTLAPYNHLLLLPAVVLILRHHFDLWSRGPLQRIAVSLLAVVGVLPWLLAPFVMIGLIMPTSAWLLNFRLVPLFASLALPFAVLGLLLLLAKTLPSESAAALTSIPAFPLAANT